MAGFRTFMSIPVVLLAVMGLAGCYDLSDPDGPHRSDFVRSPDENQTQQQQQQDQTAAGSAAGNQVRCQPAPCDAAKHAAILVVRTVDSDHAKADDVQRKILVVPDDQP